MKKNLVGIFFLSVGKKKCQVEKNFHRTFPGMQDQKTAEAEKKPLGPTPRPRGKKMSN